jgi:hypothetical protein
MRRGSFQSIELRRYVLNILGINKGIIAPLDGITRVLEPYYKKDALTWLVFSKP